MGLEAYILPTNAAGKSSTLIWHHNLQDYGHTVVYNNQKG